MSDQSFEMPQDVRVPVPTGGEGPVVFAPAKLRKQLLAITQPPEPEPALPLDRHKTVEAGLAAFQQLAADRDNLKRELLAVREELTRRDVRLEEMNRLTNLIESRINTALIQRDAAVSEAARYDGLFVAIDAIIRKVIPASPLTPSLQGRPDEGPAG